MSVNKEVLKYCPNFNKIINYKYESEDIITDKLMVIYRNFIFKANINDETESTMVKDLDYVINKYIDDFLFRKELKKEIVHIKVKKSCTDILKEIVSSVLNIFKNYLFMTTRKITIARWI